MVESGTAPASELVTRLRERRAPEPVDAPAVRVVPRDPAARPVGLVDEVHEAQAAHINRWADADGFEKGAPLVKVRIEGHA